METDLSSLNDADSVSDASHMVTSSLMHVKNETIDGDNSRNEGGEEMLMVDPSLVTGTTVDDKNVVPVNVVLSDGTVLSTINVNTLENGTIDLQSLQKIALQNLVASQILMSPGENQWVLQVEDGTDSNSLAASQFLRVSDVRSLIQSEASSVDESLPLHVQIEKQSGGDERSLPRRHRGGWPKGKKRKPEKVTGAPKPPATGYLLYTIERRAELKAEKPAMTFAEQVKVMGNEWSHKLTDQQKQKYSDLAAEDRKRYIAELQVYQESDTVQQYVANTYKDENVPFINGNSLKISENSLFCGFCDVYFSNHHNKSEHMLGSKHLSKITKLYEEERKKNEKESEDLNSSLNSDPGQSEVIEGSAASQSKGESCSKEAEPLDVSGFMLRFMQKNEEREQEMVHLKERVDQSELESAELMQKYHDFKDVHEVVSEDLCTLRTYGLALTAQIHALYTVPTLFGVKKPFQ